MNHKSPITNKQFVFLRTDLQGFTTGALAAQAAHASIAAIEIYKEHLDTIEYLRDIENLTTIVYGIKEQEIEETCKTLDSLNISYYTWIENNKIKTCIATRPVNTAKINGIEALKSKFKLFR